MQKSKNKRFLKLRAHHILCIQGFQGYGYDGQFNSNLKKIHFEIFSGKLKKIKIIITPDEICKYCPFSSGKICFKRKRGKLFDIKRLDLKVLKVLKIKVGTIISIEKLFEMTKIKHKLRKICAGCEWQQKCLWYMS